MEAVPPGSVLQEQQPTKTKGEGSRDEEEEEEEEEQVSNELRAKWDAPPPQISDEDLATTLRVVRALAGTKEIKRARYMNLRIACGRIVKVVKKSSKERKADRKVKKRKQLEEDQHLRQKTALRTKRLEKKQRTKYMCLPAPDAREACEIPKMITNSAEPVPNADSVTVEPVVEHEFLPEKLKRELCCYTCKVRFDVLHHFYDLLCPDCAKLNYEKRMQMADLKGRIALVTGGRIKIGFEIVVRLLRCGAEVIVTTRFPKDAVLRYSQEADYSEWKDRLHVYGLDLRQLPALHSFLDHVKATFPHLDMIINNAAQTVRRPPSFYSHLMKTESLPVSQLPINPSAVHLEFATSLSTFALTDGSPAVSTSFASGLSEDHQSSKVDAMEEDDKEETEKEKEKEKEGDKGKEKEQGERMSRTTTATSSNLVVPESVSIHEVSPSAALSVVPLMEGDEVHDTVLFPPNAFDEDNQQIDLRPLNSWTLPLGQVSTVEAVEVMAINTLAPFVINSKLKDMLIRSGRETFIINVSAMEGQFYRKHKTEFHPHTNMAKAALNMMTRTSAPALARDKIYMNSVDTGWINDESPHPIAEANAKQGFSPPLDEIDAAMRVLDPIFHAVKTGEFIYGAFMKDYKSCPW